MRTRRSILTMIGLSALIGTAAAFTAPNDDVKAKVGEEAPNFTLKDAEGKEYSLADYKGKIVVLQWINPDCPVCRRVASTGLVNTMVKKLKEIDSEIVHLAINSTHYMDGAKSAAYLKKHKIEAPALIDQDGTVGHMYGALTTPHMYVIDTEGVLRYQGAFDNDPSGNNDDATNYVINAVTQITEGETVSPDYAKPYGCKVKYKE